MRDRLGVYVSGGVCCVFCALRYLGLPTVHRLSVSLEVCLFSCVNLRSEGDIIYNEGRWESRLYLSEFIC